MSYSGRPLPSHLRAPSASTSQPSTGQSPVLLARIAEKKAELANLKELQVLSAGLADQMQTLEDKLATLSNGTEAVAAVLSNWHNVLRAINIASIKLATPKASSIEETAQNDGVEPPLPQTLVRIPTQQAALLPRTSETQGAGAD
ncbi:hypothetical protein M501DRAFT_930050 [Patellaria atrata CBS 101060]|uniref:DASH complex subunit DAD2 n=1 Tax=Patellaria atrata CBS 101060 TaxID=1346257 RepID=A0A9P4SE95_9PEZI|nr:hypothetical protein M501DRAFT_930050 [Patellaria atrata CBS 101060]